MGSRQKIPKSFLPLLVGVRVSTKPLPQATPPTFRQYEPSLLTHYCRGNTHFGGMGVRFCRVLAMRAAMQYCVNHAHLVWSPQQSSDSSSRSQARATSDCVCVCVCVCVFVCLSYHKPHTQATPIRDPGLDPAHHDPGLEAGS